MLADTIVRRSQDHYPLPAALAIHSIFRPAANP
jgi:hypothetical protein